MKKKSKVILFCVVGVVLTLVLVPMLIDWSKYEKKAKDLLVEKTGFGVDIAGGLSVAILPTPRLKVSDVTLYEARSKDRPVLKVGDAQVLVNPFSLLMGKVHVSSVKVQDSVVDLYVNADGKKNWDAKVKNDDAEKGVVINESINEKKSADAQGSSFSFDHVKLENLTLRFEDVAAGTKKEAVVEHLLLEAKDLQGPYLAEGRAKMMGEALNFNLKAGRYDKGNSLPVSLELTDQGENLNVRFSGVVDMTNDVEVQGEMSLGLAELDDLYSGFVGGDAPEVLSHIAKLSSKGLLTASSKGVWLNNAFIDVNDNRADFKFELSGFDADLMTVASSIAFKEHVDINALQALMDKAGGKKASSAAPASAQQEKGAVSSSSAFLPSDIVLPKNLKANINMAVPGVIYNNKKTREIRFAMTYDDGTLKTEVDALSLPESTTFKADANLTYKTQKKGLQVVLSDPQLKSHINLSTKRLSGVVSDWLAIVPAGTLPSETPEVLILDADVSVKGRTARIDLKDSNVGETRLSGFAQWQSRDGQRPLLKAKIDAGKISLPDFAQPGASAEKSTADGGAASTTQKADSVKGFDLPFDMDVALGAQRLQYGQKTFSKVKADLSLAGNSLNIRRLSVGDHMGASVRASGKVKDIQKLTGMDVDFYVNSKEIDKILGFYNVELPENLPSPLGALTVSADLKGSASAADFDVRTQVQGFNIRAHGKKADLLSKALPAKLTLSAKHGNSRKAIQVLHPSYRAQSSSMNRPFSFDGELTAQSYGYKLSQLVMNLGPSNIKGDAELHLAKKPYVKANVSADNLPLSVLAGKANQTASGKSSGGSSGRSSSSGAATPWTRDAINTDGLRALNADLDVKADRLSFGTSEFTKATLVAKLKDGVLDVSKLSAKVGEGDLNATAQVKAVSARKPIEMTAKMALENTDMASFSKAFLGGISKTLNGDIAFNLDVAASGISSAALVNALNGGGQFKLTDPVLNGVDLKAMGDSLKSLDSFRGGIVSFLDATTGGGSTAFKSVDKSFKIVNGAIPVENWDMETGNAVLLSNGVIDFANWKIDLNNQIQLQGIDNVPSFGMRVYGPLDNPRKAFSRQSLEDFMSSKIGSKAQEFVTDKLISEKFQGKLQDKLGVGIDQLLPFGQKKTAPANDNAAPQVGDTSGQGGANVQPQQQQQQQGDPAEQILKGVIGGLLGGQ